MFLAILRADSSTDISEQLRPVILLMKKLDKMSAKNNEIFVKAYFRLHVISFPTILALYSAHL